MGWSIGEIQTTAMRERRCILAAREVTICRAQSPQSGHVHPRSPAAPS